MYVKRYLPTFITGTRLALVPVLLACAALGQSTAVVALIALCFFSDLVDGFLARYWRVVSDAGARLDSWADFTFYLAIPLAGWWAFPAITGREAPYFAALVASIVVPPLLALAKFHRVPSYHTWGAKLSAASVGIGVLLLFAFDLPWPFRIATGITVTAALEETAITLVLDTPRSNVRSLWHVLRRH